MWPKQKLILYANWCNVNIALSQFGWVQKQSTLCFKKVHPYDTGWPLTWRTWKSGNLTAVREKSGKVCACIWLITANV